MSKRTKVDIVRELPASAIQWDLAPLPREEYDSYPDMVVAVTIQCISYREMVRVLLELLADAYKRLEACQRAINEYRIRERARHNVHR